VGSGGEHDIPVGRVDAPLAPGRTRVVSFCSFVYRPSPAHLGYNPR